MDSKIKVYSYKLCSSCRKSLKWLASKNLDFEVLDIINNPPNKELLRKALIQYENRKVLINLSGASYRALGAQKVNAMTNEEVIVTLVTDPKLIKRPFVVTKKGEILIGFKEDIWERSL